MKRTLSGLIAAGALTSLLMLGLVPKKHRVIGLVSTVHAQEGCSLATLQGEYLVYGGAEARLDQRDDATFPRRQIEIWNSDGAGNISGFLTFNSGGRVRRDVPTSATYEVNADLCAALVTFASGAQWEVFMTRDGSEGATIRVDADETGNTIIANRYLKRR